MLEQVALDIVLQMNMAGTVSVCSYFLLKIFFKSRQLQCVLHGLKNLHVWILIIHSWMLVG